MIKTIFILTIIYSIYRIRKSNQKTYKGFTPREFSKFEKMASSEQAKNAFRELSKYTKSLTKKK